MPKSSALRVAGPGETAAPKFEIPRPVYETIQVKLEGLSPLVVHRWSEKALGMMTAKQAGAPKTRKRDIRDPAAEFEAASYRIGDDYGFPAGAFKLAAVSACRLIDGLTMTQARSLFVCPQEFAILTNPKPTKGETWPTMDTRPVRVGMGAADIRYRPLFWPWACTLEVRFFKGATSVEQIGYLLQTAGESVGIGEMRPEKGGNYGRFRIAD